MDKYLILFPKGWTKAQFGDLSEAEAFAALEGSYPSVAQFLTPFAEKGRSRYDKGDYWWEMRACDYYREFERGKIVIPAIVNGASYAFDLNGSYSNDKTSIIPIVDKYLLGLLNSKLVDFVLKQISSTKRGGYFEYKPMYVSILPIVADPEAGVKAKIESLVEQVLANKENGADTAGLEEEIDRVVYGLYGLGDGEIGVVEGHTTGHILELGW